MAVSAGLSTRKEGEAVMLICYMTKGLIITARTTNAVDLKLLICQHSTDSPGLLNTSDVTSSTRT